MVKVRQDHPIAADGNVDIDAWIERINDIDTQPEATRTELHKACELNLAAAGVPSDFHNNWGADADTFEIGRVMDDNLAESLLDQDTLVAAFFYLAVKEY